MNKVLCIMIAVALLMLLSALTFGSLAGLEYAFPGQLRQFIGFETLRPLHVSSALFWILIAASACVLWSLNELRPNRLSKELTIVQLVLWIVALCGVFYSYFSGRFGGREYWEFDPVWAGPIALAWLIMLINFVLAVRKWRHWPVYVWMWMTGMVFFLFIFAENQLWQLPYFKDKLISDMTIQWKVNGSIVGAWNQLLYGTAFYLMDRMDGKGKVGSSNMAFVMYFLGLFNLMFNWGHHVYTLPTAPYVRYIGYLVSMTEWVFFVRILYKWKSSWVEAKEHYNHFSYRFLLASNLWVFLNMGQAILMSIPAINLYTHGTHITVAHAMGTTIGINTMILLAACFEFLPMAYQSGVERKKWPKIMFHVGQVALLVFWLSLNLAGYLKGVWQMSEQQSSFRIMMQQLQIYFDVFASAGIVLFIVLGMMAIWLIKLWLKFYKNQNGIKKSIERKLV